MSVPSPRRMPRGRCPFVQVRYASEGVKGGGGAETVGGGALVRFCFSSGDLCRRARRCAHFLFLFSPRLALLARGGGDTTRTSARAAVPANSCCSSCCFLGALCRARSRGRVTLRTPGPPEGREKPGAAFFSFFLFFFFLLLSVFFFFSARRPLASFEGGGRDRARGRREEGEEVEGARADGRDGFCCCCSE